MRKTLQIVGDSKYGGASYLILKWCRYLIEHGWQVDVLATDPVFLNELKKIPSVNIVNHVNIPREIAPVEDLRAFLRLFKLLRKENYHVVHTYTATPGLIGRMAARLAGIPVILHHQAGWTVTAFSSPVERFLFTPLEYLATLASTKGICVSHATAQQASELRLAPRNKLVTIRNGIDPLPFINAQQNGVGSHVRRLLNIPDDHLLIGCTGRLAKQKDVSTLIRSLIELKELIPNKPFTLLLVGDGPEREGLEALTHELGLSDRIYFSGFRQDIPAILASLDLFVSPSLWEGLSISLLEAMASAKSIVASSIPPNAELICHEVSGILVPPRSPKHIAEAMARFANDPAFANQCAKRAQQQVLEHYSIDRMFQETWDLYHQLLHIN